MSLLPKNGRQWQGINCTIDDDLHHFDVIDMIDRCKKPVIYPLRTQFVLFGPQKIMPGYKKGREMI